MPILNLSLEEVSRLVGGGEILGDRAFRCAAVASLEAAGPEDLSFLRSAKQMARARTSSAGALLVPERLEGVAAHQLVVADPFAAFAVVLRHIDERRRAAPGVDPRAAVDRRAALGAEVAIGPGAVVCRDAIVGDRVRIAANAYVGERSVVGEDSVLYPGVIVMEDVVVGRRVVIHPGAVLGADGYGFMQVEGRHVKVPQVGGVEVGDDVEIGALATIDRATIDQTVIGRGTKIGDLVHVAHNCRIGEDVLLFPTVSISGSCRIGDRVIFAGRAGCADNLEIGEGAILGGTAVAWKDVAAGARLWGNPAREKILEMRIQSALAKLPQMQRELRKLGKDLGSR